MSRDSAGHRGTFVSVVGTFGQGPFSYSKRETKPSSGANRTFETPESPNPREHWHRDGLNRLIFSTSTLRRRMLTPRRDRWGDALLGLAVIGLAVYLLTVALL